MKESTLYDQEASSFLRGALGRNSKSCRLRRAGREHVEVDKQIFGGVEALREERRLIGCVRINLKLNSQRTVLQRQKGQVTNLAQLIIVIPCLYGNWTSVTKKSAFLHAVEPTIFHIKWQVVNI